MTKEKPVSDELFRAYRSLYSYDKAPLNATVEPYGKDEEFWTAEKITYTAAYGNERAIAYLFLPKKGKPPYQTVLFFPGSNALLLRTFALYSTASSRCHPEERPRRTVSRIQRHLRAGRRHGIGRSQHQQRLAGSRHHVGEGCFARHRLCRDAAGSRPRKDGVLRLQLGRGNGWPYSSRGYPHQGDMFSQLGGLDFQRSLPEVDVINFISHVKQPTLMLNGRYDFFFPVESTQEPFLPIARIDERSEEASALRNRPQHPAQRTHQGKLSTGWICTLAR